MERFGRDGGFDASPHPQPLSRGERGEPSVFDDAGF